MALQENGQNLNCTLTFIKPKMNDSGLYTVKVVSRRETVVETFNLHVGPWIDDGNAIVIGKARRQSMVPTPDEDFRKRLKKVKKLEGEGGGVTGEVWNLLKNGNSREYEKIAFNYGITDLRGMLKRLNNTKKNNKKGQIFTTRLPDTAAYMLGDKIVLECETANEALNVKWTQNGRDLSASKHVQILNNGTHRSIVIDSCVLADDSMFVCSCNDEKTACEVYVREPPVTIVTGFEDVQVTDGEEAVFKAEISSDRGRFKILRDGIELTRSDGIRIKRKECQVFLSLATAQLDDAGFYQIITNGDESFAELIVEEKPIEFKSGFSDMSVNFNESAEFKCEVSEAEAKGKWFKDGKEVVASDRIEVIERGCLRKLVINDVTASDQGEYEFRVEGKQPISLMANLSAVEVIVEKKTEPPKIYLNKSENKEMVLIAGGQAKLDFSITGDPAPTVQWLQNGEPLADGDGIATVKADEKISLVISKAKREHTGIYTLVVTSEAGEDKTDITIKVIDKPSAPGKPVISELTDETARADWTPPLDDGDCSIRGYLVERKKVKANRWIRLNGDLATYHHYLVKRLVDGNTYQVRLTAVNECGQGPPSEPSEPFTPIAPTSEVTSFRLGKITDESIELLWRQPAEVGAAGIAGYIVELQTIPGKMGKAKAEDAIDSNWKPARDELIDAKSIKINLTALDTGKNYFFRICTQNAAGRSKWVTVGPICCAESIEEPKINVPRHLNRRIKVPIGEKLHLNIPFQGSPKPTVSWSKFDLVQVEVPQEAPPAPEEPAPPAADGEAPAEGEAAPAPPAEAVPAPEPVFETVRQAAELGEHVLIRNNKDATTLVIRSGERSDSGIYRMTITVGDQIVEHDFDVAVIDYPSKVRSLVIEEVIGTAALLKWKVPKDDGNCELIGYQVEKRDKKSGPDGEWYVAFDKVRHCQANVQNLIIGNEFEFRVKAINEVGLGEGAKTKNFAQIVKAECKWEKPEYKSNIQKTAPEFTTEINSRNLVVGYNGVLHCAVKGNPAPKISWFKNQLSILPKIGPKYRSCNQHGLIQLEVLRAKHDDSGTYKIVAENEVGKVSIECNVVVKEPKEHQVKELDAIET